MYWFKYVYILIWLNYMSLEVHECSCVCVCLCVLCTETHTHIHTHTHTHLRTHTRTCTYYKGTHWFPQTERGTRRCARMCFCCWACRSQTQSRSSWAAARGSSASRSCGSCWWACLPPWTPPWRRRAVRSDNVSTLLYILYVGFSLKVQTTRTTERCFGLSIEASMENNNI